MRAVSAVVLVVCLLFAGGQVKASNVDLPDTLSFGAGWQEIRKNSPYVNGGDFRLEYRFGLSLLSSLIEPLEVIDPFLQIHPELGVETSTHGQIYAHGGLIFDFLLGDHIVVSPNFAIGHYTPNQGKDLGYPWEIRSTLEAGYRFDSGYRVTAYVSHISNAAWGDHNPGVEMAGLYLHVPLTCKR